MSRHDGPSGWNLGWAPWVVGGLMVLAACCYAAYFGGKS